MRKMFTILVLLSFFSKAYSSEYYGLLVGYDDKGQRVMKGTCRSFPLNTFLHILGKKKEITNFFPSEKLEYISFKTLRQTENDDFYFENKAWTDKTDLKDPEILRKYLGNLYFTILKKKTELMKAGIFKDKNEVESFTEPILTLIGILETMTENNCKKVTWIAKLY